MRPVECLVCVIGICGNEMKITAKRLNKILEAYPKDILLCIEDNEIVLGGRWDDDHGCFGILGTITEKDARAEDV